MNRKILFVDDCSTTLLMEQVLPAKQTDYTLIRARDGWEAIQKAEEERPDLILLDGVRQNVDACREMRKIPELQRVPILMITRVGGPSIIENGPPSALNDDLSKPLNWRVLLEMVDTYLDSHSVSR